MKTRKKEITVNHFQNNKFSLFIIFIIILSLGVNSQDSQGTLSLKIKPFLSEIKLRKKIIKQLESGALEWGVSGNQFVTTLVNKRFLNFIEFLLSMFDNFGIIFDPIYIG